MRLLILTQKVDKNDDLLGFFHEWLREFSEHFEQITVICLGKGEYDLPDNVSVYSLGKEEEQFSIFNFQFSILTRLHYVFRFFRYIIRFRKEYDVVFVHMNPEYALLGGLLWRLWGKRILMWYNHPKGNAYIRFAHFVSFRVLHTSPFAFAKQFSNALQMPVGIPTEHFKKNVTVEKKKNTFLSLGRISPIKKVDLMLEATHTLQEKNIRFDVSLYGSPTNEEDSRYSQALAEKHRTLIQRNIIAFCGSVPHNKTAEVYNRHEFFLNTTPSGSFDKAILEAMACELIVITSNQSLRTMLPTALLPNEGSVSALAESMEYALSLSSQEKEQQGKLARAYVVREHSLIALAKCLKQLCVQ